MNLTYSSAFKEQALLKVYSRGERTIQSVADELNVKQATLKIWMKRKMKQVRQDDLDMAKEKRPHEWRVEEQLRALQETYGLSEEEKHAWCREHGLFPHDLINWQTAFCKVQTAALPRSSDKQELRTLKEQNGQLKRELNRKEKALAEAAALLILQKKFNALWEDEAP